MSSTLPAPANPALFLRRWLANPLQMGSIVPSGSALCARVVAAVRRDAPAEWPRVIELGAGTGVIGRALLHAGLPPDRLTVVEIVPEMAAHLRRALPGARIVQGDARDLPALLPGVQADSMICGIPLVLLARPMQRRFIDAMDAIAPGRGFLHFSYCVTSPLPARAHGLQARREAWVARNFPPASLWRYTPLQ